MTELIEFNYWDSLGNCAMIDTSGLISKGVFYMEKTFKALMVTKTEDNFSVNVQDVSLNDLLRNQL